MRAVLPGLLVLAACGGSASAPAPAASPPATPVAPPVAPRSRVDALVADLVDADWSKVDAAKQAIESEQAAAVPALLALLDDRRVVKLEGTMDLIYPGAPNFYGHGEILDYDVDWLPIRAGWVLDEIAYQDFGFREGAIDEATLLASTKERGFETRPLAGEVQLAPDRRATRLARDSAIEHAKAWWKAEGATWTRYAALLAALRSDVPARHMKALCWLRFGDTRCDGLDAARAESEVLPEIRRLASAGTSDVRVQAKLLLDDKDLHWAKWERGKPR